MLGARPPDHFEVEPENWPALLAFISCETQWRYANSGLRLGLDYPALESVVRLQKIPNKPDVFRRVQIMERAALAFLNKR